LSGLACMSFAPQAQAQLSLRYYTQTDKITDGLFSSDSFTWQQFNTTLVNNAAASLASVQFTLVGVGSVGGTVTNTSGVTKSFTLESGSFIEAPLFGLPGGGAPTLNLAGVGTNNMTVLNGHTMNFGRDPISASATTGPLTSANGAFTGTGAVTSTTNQFLINGFSGNANGLSAFQTSSGGSLTARLTYAYYIPFTPVPELGTSISLGLMGLVGGALGLRARRRSK